MIKKISRIFLKIIYKLLREFIKALFLILPFRDILINEINKISNEFIGKNCFIGVTKEVKYCLQLLKKEPQIFIDIGANIGRYTDQVIKNHPDIVCHLFEPSKTNYKKLKIKYQQKNIFINRKALADVTGESYLYSDMSGSSLGSLTKRDLTEFNINFNLKEKVDLIRFDKYWKNFNLIIDYVKIDVEGHELDVLKGFGDLIYNTKLIQFEFGGTAIDTRIFFKDFWNFFKLRNFSIYRMTPIGLKKINKYSETEESFSYSNFIAYNNNF